MQTNTSTFRNTFDSTDSSAAQFHDGVAAVARSKDDLVKDFQNLITEGEALLKSTTSLSGEALAQARERFRDKLNEAKTQAEALSDAAKEGGRRAMVATEDYVRANPWPAVGMAAGLGFLVAALSIRR
jgi:ElaB/YqjD/DUF883 family membrane-anchored ribosome-binding protein